MARDDEAPPAEGVLPARTVELASGYELAVLPPSGADAPGEQLVLSAKDGRVCLRITLGPAGPEVTLEAASLTLRADGPLRLAGEEVSIESASSLALRSGADVRVEAEGSMALRAREQHLEATHGDVHVEANDDVRVDGERVRLNAPDAAPLRRRHDG